MKKMKKNINFLTMCFYVFLVAFSFVVLSPTVFAATDNKTVTATVTTYNEGSKTVLPNFEKGSEETDKVYKDYDGSLSDEQKTVITICTWEQWEWDNTTNKFVKVTYTTKPSQSYKNATDSSTHHTSVLYEPTNEKGLKDKTETGYETRSGYGFKVNSYFNVQDTTNDPSNLRASLLFPEFNFSTDLNKFNDMTVSQKKTTQVNDTETVVNGSSLKHKILTFVFNLTDNFIEKDNEITGTDSKPYHYTPMWYKDGSYTPVLKVGGLWSPIAEVQYNVKQITTDDPRFTTLKLLETNDYVIKGSLFDDMYTTHDKFE